MVARNGAQAIRDQGALSTARVGRPQFDLSKFDFRYPAFPPEPYRLTTRNQFYPFGHGLLYLLFDGRHLLPAAAVYDAHFSGTTAYGSAGAIQGSVTSAYHDYGS